MKRREVEEVKVLLVAPACDGEDVGEAWVAFQWAKVLSERVNLSLLTTYKRGHTPPARQLPGVRVIQWQEPPGVGRFERLNSLLEPGYLPFYIYARQWIKSRQAAGERFDIAHQVVPVAMRYPSPAAGLGIPLVIGPVGGSIESPPKFVAEEGGTPWWQQLRKLDALRIRHDPLLRHTYESAACVVGIAEYVRCFLSPISIRRLELMSETAVHEVRAPINRSGRTGPVRLLWVGRIVRTKGLRDIIRALNVLSDVDVVLDVVGDGNDRQACEQLALQLNLEHRVTFHGHLPRSAVDSHYEKADIFVFPSYREPGGNVSLEAMSFGLPLIVCRRGGPGANVDDSCAIRLDADSPTQLAAGCADAIRTLVQDADLRMRMGDAARVRALSTHLWTHRVERMTGWYDELAGAEIPTVKPAASVPRMLRRRPPGIAPME